MGKRLSDLACCTVIGFLLLGEAERSERKRIAARRFICRGAIRCAAIAEEIHADDDTAVRDYRLLLERDVPKD
jgi:hypothetical protein